MNTVHKRKPLFSVETGTRSMAVAGSTDLVADARGALAKLGGLVIYHAEDKFNEDRESILAPDTKIICSGTVSEMYVRATTAVEKALSRLEKLEALLKKMALVKTEDHEDLELAIYESKNGQIMLFMDNKETYTLLDQVLKESEEK